MEIIKKNITLVLGISIPILMILFVAGSIYLPSLFIKPHFNFLYASGGNYYYNQQQFSIQDGRLTRNDIKQSEKQKYYQSQKKSELYIYDITKNKAREVSFMEAQKLSLDTETKSPDGFTIVYGSRGNGGIFPFFSGSERDYAARYLKGHNVSRKLNLQPDGGHYYSNFRFLGWIK